MISDIWTPRRINWRQWRFEKDGKFIRKHFRNKKEYLEDRVVELNKLSAKKLEELFRKSLERKEELEDEAETEMKKKHHVQ